ncbi:MAG: hypothetical protein ABSG57_03410 [Candidatus Bathyarchaeia archaeon]
MAVESAANAMILELGGDEAKDLQAISGFAVVLRRVKPELLMKDEYVQLIDKGREIQREVVYARCPLKGGWQVGDSYGILYSRENHGDR